MRRVLRAFLYLPLLAALLLLFVVAHEMGHTILARLLGDPASTFYLVKLEESSACFGCNIYDQSKLAWGPNLLVSLGGLLATQLLAVALLLFPRYGRGGPRLRRWAGATGLSYVFLDVLVQGVQGLLYDVEQHTWPTDVDLLDVMLLIRQRWPVPQLYLKGTLVLVGAAWLFLSWRHYRRSSTEQPKEAE